MMIKNSKEFLFIMKNYNFKLFRNNKHQKLYKVKNKNYKPKELQIMRKQLKNYSMKLILRCNLNLKMILNLKQIQFKNKLTKDWKEKFQK